MAFSAARFRRWFGIAILVVCIAIAGTFFYARHRVQNALQQVPEKLNVKVQQSAEAFTISKSEQGRTLFKLQANKAVQYKGNGRVELTDVMLTIYGQDSSRFDQIYGKSFEYDQKSGNVTSSGEVSIDLQSNPQGASSSDQSTPRELKNPIHLKTSNLIFNQKTGDARTDSKIEFYVPELSGSAVGARYDAHQGTLALQSKVEMTTSGEAPVRIHAQRATLSKNPREIELAKPQAESRTRRGEADEARLFLRDDNSLDHAIGVGNVVIDSIQSKASSKSAPAKSEILSQMLEVAMRDGNRIQSAVFSGNVRLRTEGAQQSQGSAGRVVLSFVRKNAISKVHAEGQVSLLSHEGTSDKTSQDVEVTSPALDAFLGNANRLTRAETQGPPEIHFIPTGRKRGSDTHVTADKFIAKFDSLGQLSQVHGQGNARTVTIAAPENGVPQSERVTTSDMIDAYFRPGTGIESMIQSGHFTYASGTQQAFADQARYTPADQILFLTGNPRVIDTGMESTGRTVRLNRASGQAVVEGDVKTSYSDLKPQASGALFASSDPIHVTADSMTARGSSGTATYNGKARVWQNANVLQAPAIQFRKEPRVVIASSNSREKVLTALTSVDKDGKATPVHITSDHLTYADAERKAHYEGSVNATSENVTLSSNQMDVFFANGASGREGVASRAGSPGGEPPPAAQASLATGAKLEKIIASGSVVITQPNRRATGDKLTYTPEDGKFVLTGGPPAIFDAKQGKVTGNSVTMFRDDDRIIVEGNNAAPAVTETNISRTH